MAANPGQPKHRKQTALVIADRRRRTVQLYLTGQHTMEAIAEILDCSPATISRMISSQKKVWEEQSLELRDDYVKMELEKLNQLEHDAYHQIRNVQIMNLIADLQEKMEALQEGDEIDEDLLVAIKALRGPDVPTFIDKMLKIADRRSKLLGLDAPIRHELAGPGGGPINARNVTSMTDNQLEAIAGGS